MQTWCCYSTEIYFIAQYQQIRFILILHNMHIITYIHYLNILVKSMFYISDFIRTYNTFYVHYQNNVRLKFSLIYYNHGFCLNDNPGHYLQLRYVHSFSNIVIAL